MSETSLLTPINSTDRIPNRAMLYGMALCSFAALLLELALTRLFSVVLFYHFAFLAISIALLGLGAGGVFAHLRKDRLARFETRALVSRLCSVNALIVPVVLVIVLRTPVSLEISTANFLRLTAIYLASAVPFFITGLEFSVVFAREASHVSPLYAADLAGGALACLAIVPLLNWLGGPNTVFFTGVCMAVAGAIWATDRKGAKVRRRAGPVHSGADRGQLLLQPLRHRLRQGRVSRFRLGGIRPLECHFQGGSGFPGQGARRL